MRRMRHRLKTVSDQSRQVNYIEHVKVKDIVSNQFQESVFNVLK